MTKFVRQVAIVAVLAMMALALSGWKTAEDKQLLDAVNGLRVSNGRAALQEEKQLNVRAREWARTLASGGGLRHSDLRTLPVPFSRAAENVAYAGTVEQMHGMLAASPSHRANMLDARYTGIGIGTFRAPNGLLFGVEVFFAP